MSSVQSALACSRINACAPRYAACFVCVLCIMVGMVVVRNVAAAVLCR